MAEKMLKTRIQHKHEPEANWLQATNFIPLAGELIVYDIDETHDKPRFKIGDGIRNPNTGKIEGTTINDLPFVSEDLAKKAEDNESLIIGEEETNRAGTKGFRIVKAQRETQADGSYKYYYYLVDNSEIIENQITDIWTDIEGQTWAVDHEPGELPTSGKYTIEQVKYYSSEAQVDFMPTTTSGILLTNFSGNSLTQEQILKIKEIEFNGNTVTVYLDEVTTELLKEFQETLSASPETTNTLYTYYINSSTGNLGREYTDDYGKTYEATREGEYIKVRVEKVKKSYQPVPDSGKDPAGYEWQPTPENANIYEIDYTDTWEHGQYSYFRLSVNPYLGTEWMETNGIVVGGSNNQALGKDSFATGSDNIANGAHSAAFGDENYVNYAGIASGRKNKVLEKSGAAFGEKNIVRGYGSTAIGGNNEVGPHTYATAIGWYLKTHSSGELVAGQYNQATHDKSVALSVGSGWSEATRKDAITVYKDGTTKVLGDVYSGSTNVTQTAKNAKASADSATAAANKANTDITSLENAVEIMNDRLTADVDELYEFTKNIKDDRTTLQLGELPEKGVVDKLYITGNSEQYIYKIRKTPKVDKDKVWKGTIQTSKPTGLKGSGTENDPYQITNGNELSYIVRNTQGYYSKLMNDIYLNDISNPNWKETANTWVNIASNRSFKGVFDGCNHTVYGLYYNQPADAETANSYVGCALFPCIFNGFSTTPIVIKNIGLDYVYVNSSSNAGALVGVTQSSNYEIKNCWIGENVELLGTYVASIHTWGNGKALIENCYSLANANVIEGATRYPAFAQANWWNFNPSGEGKVTDSLPTFKNCYALNTRLNNNTDSTIKVENCYCTVSGGKGTVITKKDMTGINALDNMPGLNTYIEGGKVALGKNKLEYFNELENGYYNSNTGYANIVLNEDGTIHIESAGYSPDEIAEPEIIRIPIGRIANYDSNNSYIASCKIQPIDENPFYAKTSSELLDDTLYFNITPRLGEPPSSYNIYPQVEEGTVATEWEKPNIVEIESNGWVYINDYTYPHLTSFVEGWKCIDKDDAKTLTAAKTYTDNKEISILNNSKKYTDEKTKDLYENRAIAESGKKFYIVNDGAIGTKCIIKLVNGCHGWPNEQKKLEITSLNFAKINSKITTSGYTQDGIAYSLTADGGVKISGMATKTNSFCIAELHTGWGADGLGILVYSDISGSNLLYVKELDYDNSSIITNSQVITKDGIYIHAYGTNPNAIHFDYEEGVKYNAIVYPQVEVVDTVNATKPRNFIPYKEYSYTILNEEYDNSNIYVDGPDLISGEYEFIIPEIGEYLIKPTTGWIDLGDITYTAIGNYGMNIITDLQAQIDELKQALNNVNSILATLVEGSAE